MLVVRVIRQLRASSVDSSVSDTDLLGGQGLVLLPVSPQRTGKVRVTVKGRDLELIAHTHGPALDIGAVCHVCTVEEDGAIRVSQNPL